MPDIFSIAGRRLGSLDMLLPVFMKVKDERPDTKIHLIFPENRPYEQLRRDVFLSRELDRLVSDYIVLNREVKKKASPVRRLASAFGVLPCALRMFASPRFVLLHARELNSPLLRLLRPINKIMRGRVFEHFRGLILTLNRTPEADENKPDEKDGFLCFGPHDRPYLEKMGKTKIHEIGYPRLYRVWTDRLREVSGEYIERELSALGLPTGRPIVSLLLASTVEGLFSMSELERWLDDAFFAVRSRMPEAVILLKPHPSQKMDHLKEYLNKLSAENAAITFLHPGILVSSSRVVISHHSSTIIDAMALGAPTIQFQELTDRWMKVHPEGSSFLKLGPLWAQNREELVDRLDTALSEGFQAPDIGAVLGHKENIDILVGENA